MRWVLTSVGLYDSRIYDKTILNPPVGRTVTLRPLPQLETGPRSALPEIRSFAALATCDHALADQVPLELHEDCEHPEQRYAGCASSTAISATGWPWSWNTGPAHGRSDVAVERAAATRGVVTRAISPLYTVASPRSGLLLGFTGFAPETIAPAVARLAASFGDIARRREIRLGARARRSSGQG